MTTWPERQLTVEQQSEERRAQLGLKISRIVAWAGLGFLLLLLVAGLLLPQYPQLLASVPIVLPASIAGFVYPVLLRRQRGRLAGILLSTAILLIIASGYFVLTEGVLALAVGSVLVVVIAYMILHDRDARWFIGLSILALVADIILLSIFVPNWTSRLTTTLALGLHIGATAIAILVTAAIIRQSMVDQETFFRQAQEASMEIASRARAEAAQRQDLQAAVESYVASMAEVARGDLSTRLVLEETDPSSDGPLLVLGRNLNETIASLQHMTAQVREAAANISASSSEILAATTQQAAGASEQSAAIAQTSTTIDEVRTIADQTAQRAQGVADLAQRTADVSQAGQQALADTVAEVAIVKRKVETIATGILALSEQAQTIGQIITAVSDLASQSNMLALNASVEAARAGEAGKGFAVVASEVRALAEQSRAATVQVEELLTEIQRGVNTAVMLTEEGMKGTDAGVRIAGQADAAMRQLAQSVQESVQAAAQIAAAAGQQLTGMEQIGMAVQNIQQVAAQALGGAQQSERAAGDLNSLAGQLQQLVAQYR